jgi:hypothetical protein
MIAAAQQRHHPSRCHPGKPADVSGLAADRNRRPPTALLLAEALEMIAGQIEAAGEFEQVPKTIMTARPALRVESPLAAEVTAPDLPPVTGP